MSAGLLMISGEGLLVLVLQAGTPSLRAAAEMRRPEVRLEQVARDGLEEHAACRPDEVQVRLLGDKDLPVEQELVVQRTGRHGPPRDPQPAEHAAVEW